MKAIVTGGAGFIGSHLVDRLLEDRHAVTVLDNLSCGYVENLKQHSGNPLLAFHEVDIRDATRLEKLLAGHDAVFHMAAHVNIRESLTDHRCDLENNVIGTLNILEAMAKNDIRDLVFASTSALYGETTLRPTPEGCLSEQTSLYGASKLACEAYAQAYTELVPMKLWSFRIANVVGERCRGGVIWDIVHKLLSNSKELEILGDGKQSRQYLCVGDCVNGMMVGYREASRKVNTFNLGTEEQTTVDEVADLVIEEMKLTDVRRRYTGGPHGWIGDIPVVELSVDRMKRLGWKPRLSSEEAIRRTIGWTLEHGIAFPE